MRRSSPDATAADHRRELLVLGILRWQTLSAYAIDRAVRRHTVLYRGLRHGNVYNLVGRLAESGYIGARSGKASRGPAASKNIYHVTAKGEQRFREILEAVLCDTAADDCSLQIALVLLTQLRRSQATRMLERRSKELIAQERRFKRLFGDSTRSAAAALAGSHAMSRLQSEKRFVGDALRLIAKTGSYPDWE